MSSSDRGGLRALSVSSRAKHFMLIAAAVALVDQLTKLWALSRLTRTFEPVGGLPVSAWEAWSRFMLYRHPPAGGVVTVIPDLWHFRYVENPGAVWGFLAGAPPSVRVPLLLILALAAMAFIISYFRKTTPEQKLVRLALALVFGGALGNFLDRARFGYVIDFVDWHYHREATWPTFNVADAGISVGVSLLLLDMILHRAPAEAQANTPAPS